MMNKSRMFEVHLLELKIAYVQKMKPMDLGLDVSTIYTQKKRSSFFVER
jgi:hypothetical protein